MDYFGNMDNAIASFHRFAGRAKKAVIYDADDANTRKALEGIGCRTITFGEHAGADYYPMNIVSVEGQTKFALMHDNKKLCDVTLNIPGVHNVLNALAAAAACFEVGVTPENFQGRSRASTAPSAALRSTARIWASPLPMITAIIPGSWRSPSRRPRDALQRGLGGVPAIHLLSDLSADGRLRRVLLLPIMW